MNEQSHADRIRSEIGDLVKRARELGAIEIAFNAGKVAESLGKPGHSRNVIQALTGSKTSAFGFPPAKNQGEGHPDGTARILRITF